MEKHLTIEQIKEIEPRVKTILDEATRIRPVQPNDYPDYKSRLEPLVGYEAEKKELRTSAAYCSALHALCNALDI